LTAIWLHSFLPVEGSAKTSKLLFKTQLTAVYLFAALSKVNPYFLSGKIIEQELSTSGLASAVGNPSTDLLCFLAAGVVIAELVLAIGLWLPRWRKTAMVTGVLLHLNMILLMPGTVQLDLLAFALACFSVYPQFIIGASHQATWQTKGGESHLTGKSFLYARQ
jgi:hypothetical protein